MNNKEDFFKIARDFNTALSFYREAEKRYFQETTQINSEIRAHALEMVDYAWEKMEELVKREKNNKNKKWYSLPTYDNELE